MTGFILKNLGLQKSAETATPNPAAQLLKGPAKPDAKEGFLKALKDAFAKEKHGKQPAALLDKMGEMVKTLKEKISSLLKNPQAENMPATLKKDLRQHAENLNAPKAADKEKLLDALKQMLSELEGLEKRLKKSKDAPNPFAELEAALIKFAKLEMNHASAAKTISAQSDKPRTEKVSATEKQPKAIIIDLREKIEKASSHTLTKAEKNQQAGEGMQKFAASQKSSESDDMKIIAKTISLTNAEMMFKNDFHQAFEAAGFSKEIYSPAMERFKELIKNEVLHHTRMLIKEEGNGEIKLVLKPPSLGEVRIKVTMENNHIDGQILVDNNNIKEIVEAGLKQLNQSLKEEGYDSVALQVSVNDHSQDGQAQEREKPRNPLHDTKTASAFEKNQPVASFETAGINIINLTI